MPTTRPSRAGRPTRVDDGPARGLGAGRRPGRRISRTRPLTAARGQAAGRVRRPARSIPDPVSASTAHGPGCSISSQRLGRRGGALAAGPRGVAGSASGARDRAGHGGSPGDGHAGPGAAAGPGRAAELVRRRAGRPTERLPRSARAAASAPREGDLAGSAAQDGAGRRSGDQPVPRRSVRSAARGRRPRARRRTRQLGSAARPARHAARRGAAPRTAPRDLLRAGLAASASASASRTASRCGASAADRPRRCRAAASRAAPRRRRAAAAASEQLLGQGVPGPACTPMVRWVLTPPSAVAACRQPRGR